MAERFLCCCRTGSWTRVIGWIYLVSHVVLVLFLTAMTIFLVVNGDEFNENITGTSAYKAIAENVTDGNRYRTALVSTLALLLAQLIGFGMHVVLLIGSYKKRATFLIYWIVYIVGWVAVVIILETAACVITKGDRVGISMGTIVLTLLLSAFCVWVVSDHLVWMEKSLQMTTPEITEIFCKP